jgi:POTRA domain, FtsQ-type
MRRVLRVLLWLAIAGGAALAAAWAPDAMSELEYFRANQFTVMVGPRLSKSDVLRAAAIPSHASVWDDPTEWIERIEDHPLVLSATIDRELPRRLIVRVVEREPVALFPTPVLEPVDRDGHLLPVDPADDALDLPILSPVRAGGSEAPLTHAERRVLAREAEHLQKIDPAFMIRVSELALDSDGGMIARMSEPQLDFRFRAPLSPERLHQGLEAMADAIAREGVTAPQLIDLRFADQVVVRYPSSSGRRGP